MNQRFKFKTIYGESVFTEPGDRGLYDMRIITKFPKAIQSHSLEYMAYCLALKAEVEDRNYPRETGRMGRNRLHDFCWAVLYKVPLDKAQENIRALLAIHKTPGYEKYERKLDWYKNWCEI